MSTYLLEELKKICYTERSIMGISSSTRLQSNLILMNSTKSMLDRINRINISQKTLKYDFDLR